MRAIILSAYGDTSKLELAKLPPLRAGPDQVKVRMAGAGINPIDWKLRAGAMAASMPLALPAILGREASGEVVELGAGVTRFALGARVMGLVDSAYATFIVAETAAWTHVPDGLSVVDAAALPLALLAGAQLIEEGARTKAGDTVLITGATGAVGRAAVYVAKTHGATVWAGVRSTQRATAESLGADAIVVLDDAAALEGLPMFDSIADTVGGATIARLLPKLRPTGTLASVVGRSAEAEQLGVTVRSIATHRDAARLATLAQAVADGLLVIPIAKRLPLSRAADGQRLAEQHPGGKVVLTGRPPITRGVTYLTRDDVLKLLADGELSAAQPTDALGSGDEYLDLEHLSRGVQRAGTSTGPGPRLLARKSVHERVWHRIVRQLTPVTD